MQCTTVGFYELFDESLLWISRYEYVLNINTSNVNKYPEVKFYI